MIRRIIASFVMFAALWGAWYAIGAAQGIKPTTPPSAVDASGNVTGGTCLSLKDSGGTLTSTICPVATNKLTIKSAKAGGTAGPATIFNDGTGGVTGNLYEFQDDGSAFFDLGLSFGAPVLLGTGNMTLRTSNVQVIYDAAGASSGTGKCHSFRTGGGEVASVDCAGRITAGVGTFQGSGSVPLTLLSNQAGGPGPATILSTAGTMTGNSIWSFRNNAHGEIIGFGDDGSGDGIINFPAAFGGQVQTTASDSNVGLQGNLDATESSAFFGDVQVSSTKTRTAGLLFGITNNGTMKASVSFDGMIQTASTRNVGTIALAIGTGTATVRSGAICVCDDASALALVRCSVSGTTLTATGTGTDNISYICF